VDVILPILLPILLVSGVFGGLWLFLRRETAHTEALLARGLEVESFKLLGINFARKIIRRGDGYTAVAERTSTGGKNSTPIWLIRVTPIAFAQRSSLEVAKETFLSKIADAVGWTDVRVGDPELDERLRIRGSDPETLKSELMRGELRNHLLELFSGGWLWSVKVDESGLALRGLRRGRDSVEDTERLLDASLELAKRLDGKSAGW
jgi:hypothetical protein